MSLLFDDQLLLARAGFNVVVPAAAAEAQKHNVMIMEVNQHKEIRTLGQHLTTTMMMDYSLV
jgi:hypothetical protein